MDPKDPHHPLVYVVIKKWKPFKYAVTLQALIENESRNIRRWDNVGKEEHLDVFFLKDKPKKHQKRSIKGIRKLDDLKRLLKFIDNNHKKFIKEYKK